MSRFELKNEAGDTWTLVDTVSGISLRFKEHELNETQQVSIPESFPADPVRASRIMQAMGEYMFTYHYSIAFPVPKFEIKPDEAVCSPSKIQSLEAIHNTKSSLVSTKLVESY